MVKNHEVGTRSERWYLFDTDGFVRDRPGVDAHGSRRRGGRRSCPSQDGSGRTPGEEIHGSTWVRARGESSGEELDQGGSSSSIAARRGRKRGRGENLEDTSTPVPGANPERGRQGRGGSEQRPTSSRRQRSRETTDMTCWEPHDLAVRGNPTRDGLRTKASCFGRL